MSMLLVHELHEARDRVQLLIQRLKGARERELPSYHNFLDDQIASLEKTLEEAKIPDRYRVAIVGRFKVGKSSFVNHLAIEKLAGVETSPETAAISIFRYSEEPRAEVQFVSRQEWENLASLYQENPDSQEVKRYAGFINFNKRPTAGDKEGKVREREAVDLEQLANIWIRDGGYQYTLKAHAWKSVEDKKKFVPS